MTKHKNKKFYCNISVFYFSTKDSIYFCVICLVCLVWHAGYMQHLCLSAWSVTKHGDRSPSPMGVNWVSDGVSIDFVEYMCYNSVCFYSSLE